LTVSATVRKRFYQWILDTCNRSYDQTWLDYQQEIGLRHTYAKKNQTDHVASAAYWTAIHDCLHLSHYTIKPFLASKGHNVEEVEKMHQAWFKSVASGYALGLSLCKR